MQFTDRDCFLQELPKQVEYSWLLKLMEVWIMSEDPPFKMGVLATVDVNGFPRSRTVAIREINEQGLHFFTQLGSAKVAHISANPYVSFTIMLPNTQRQVTFFGRVRPLAEAENLKNWDTYDQERKLRFLIYGTKSGQLIDKQLRLDEELITLRDRYKHILPERPREYVGYRIIPEEIKLYQLNEHRLSDSITAKGTNNIWTLERFVP